MKRIALLTAALLSLGLCACAPKKAEKPLPACTDVAGQIASALADESAFEELTALGNAQVLKYLGLSEAQVTDAAMSIDATRATAELVCVLTAADAEALKAVQEALKTYRDTTLEQYRDYRPEEVPKLESAVMKTHGLQTVLIVGKDAAAAEKALDGAWK